MTYAVLVQHRGSEREVEICRVGSEASAKQIASARAKEKFSDKLWDGTRTKPVLRYLSVRVQKVSA